MPLLLVGGVTGMFLARKAKWNALLLPSVGIMAAFYILFNIPNYHWYYAPFILVLTLYASLWVARFKVVQAVAIVLIAIQATAAWHFLRMPEGRLLDYQNIANWLDKHASPTNTVAACEIGEVGWATRRKVIDILGLTEPKNADHIAHRDVTSWLQEDRPDYIVVHRKPFVFELVASASPEYQRVPVEFGNAYLLHRNEVHWVP